jgi:hypothetical protein
MAAGRQARHLPVAGRRVLGHGKTIYRLEHCVMLITPTAQLDAAAVRLSKGKDLSIERYRHNVPPGEKVKLLSGTFQLQPIFPSNNLRIYAVFCHSAATFPMSTLCARDVAFDTFIKRKKAEQIIF